MELKVEGSDLQKLIEGAVVQALGESGKDALVKEVVRHLTTPPQRNGYGSGQRPSPLMEALHGAAAQAASAYFRAKVEKDPAFVDALEQLYTDAVKKFLDTDTRAKTIDKMADRLSSAFGERY
jgi:hypothetical protein